MLLRLLILLCTICQVFAASSSGNKILVIMESKLNREDFYDFLGALQMRQFEVTYRDPKEAEPLLVKDDVASFDHVIIFAPTTKSFAPDITPQTIVELLERNVNVLIAVSPTQTPLHSLAAEFGLIFPPPGTPLISHFPSTKTPDVVPIDLSENVTPLLQRKTEGTVFFKGVPHAVLPNPALFSVLRAPAESYATDSDFSTDRGADAMADSIEKGGEGLWAGSSLRLVSGFVAKNGARILWCGGVEMFSDEYAKKTIDGKTSVNGPFVQDLAAWTFQESLVLRIKDVTHTLAAPANPATVKNSTHSNVNIPQPAQPTYTTNDRLTYTIQLQIYNPQSTTWKPFVIPEGDTLQVSYTMIDPHIRTSLQPVKDTPGSYSTTFRTPDRHGVFKLAFNYFRTGYTPLTHSIKTSLVPPRHDGYPRFLSAAWPYYTGAISMAAGFVIFSAFWLGGANGEEKGKKKKE